MTETINIRIPVMVTDDGDWCAYGHPDFEEINDWCVHYDTVGNKNDQ